MKARSWTRRRSARAAALVSAAIALSVVSIAAAEPQFSAWTTAQKIDEIGGNSSELNTPSLDGCPIQSPDRLSLYMASNRPGGQGLLDIWVAHRTSKSAAFRCAREPGAGDQLGRGRLLPDAGSRTASSS